MNCYLVETNHLADDAATLRVFDDIELVQFLSENIEHEHYSGDGYAIKGIWHYLGAGKLRPLTLHRIGEYHDGNDYLDWSYELTSPGRTDLGDDPGLT
jgi:hypothetical protein